MILENEPPQLYCKVLQIQNIENGQTKDNLTTNQELVIGCELKTEKLKLQTSTKPLTNLTWNEEFLFLVKRRKAIMKVSVYSYPDNQTKKGNLIGFVKIGIEELTDEKPIEKWFNLENKKKENKKTLQDTNQNETNVTKKTNDNKSQQKKKKNKGVKLKLKVHFIFTKKYLFEEKQQSSWRLKFKELTKRIDISARNFGFSNLFKLNFEFGLGKYGSVFAIRNKVPIPLESRIVNLIINCSGWIGQEYLKIIRYNNNINKHQKYLKWKGSTSILKLRNFTNYLNRYSYVYDNNKIKIKSCNLSKKDLNLEIIEDIDHFVWDCPSYEKNRTTWIKKLIQINKNNKNNIFDIIRNKDSLFILSLVNEKDNYDSLLKFLNKNLEIRAILVADKSKFLLRFTDLIHARHSDKISTNFISVLRSYNKAKSFLFNSIIREISSVKSPLRLFRKNSISRNMITIFFTKIGGDYLSTILKKPVAEILKNQEIIQIDKSKLDNDEYEKNIKLVEKILQKFIDAITGSVKQIPEEIKSILLHVSTTFKNKFKDSKDYVILMVLFSRFIFSAVNNPQCYGIIDYEITQQNQENLRLVSKILHGLVVKSKLNEKSMFFSIVHNLSNRNNQKIEGFIKKTINSASVLNKNEKKKQNAYKCEFQDLIDFRNFLNKYFDRIDVLQHETKKNVKDGKKTKNALKFEDKKKKIAVLLNELKGVSSSAYRKSHNISNKQIKKQKAMKITQSFDYLNDEYVEVEGEIGILNKNYKIGNTSRKATLIAEELLELLSGLRERNIQDNNKIEEEIKKKKKEKKKRKKTQKTIFVPGLGMLEVENVDEGSEKEKDDEQETELIFLPVDWHKIENSKEYINGIQICGELKNTNLNKLNLSEKLAFWINIANCLFLHSCIVNKDHPDTFFHLREYNQDYKYTIMGLDYSREDIMQGILKDNKKYFRKKDPRRYSVLMSTMFMPYTLFAVTNMQLTSPDLFVYHGDIIDKELFDLCGRYLKKFFRISHAKSDHPKLIIPTLFQWDKSYLGGTDSKVIDFILSVLRITDHKNFNKLSLIRSQNVFINSEYTDILKKKYKKIDHQLGYTVFRFDKNEIYEKEK
ncbi:ras gtpase-activating protein [Anaeramoeba flamelloides]|uniref:Ras gtpase-activating protein n=1 Tax=Anaeramoeba flamelloides TaxID=1746091 RepID=A0ABQ8YHC8_9EUKA|nr:ras gtpase-activating protein [Anaeramoeba flamelloides]